MLPNPQYYTTSISSFAIPVQNLKEKRKKNQILTKTQESSLQIHLNPQIYPKFAIPIENPEAKSSNFDKNPRILNPNGHDPTKVSKLKHLKSLNQQWSEIELPVFLVFVEFLPIAMLVRSHDYERDERKKQSNPS